MPYQVRIITPEEKDRLYEEYSSIKFFSVKSEIYGCCIKLLTTDRRTKEMWEDNFYGMSENVRSHGRVVMIDLPGEGMKVLYEPVAKTAFLFNFDYYGWVKSIALAVAGDLLEDEHHIHSVHGASIDIAGHGVSLIAPSKTGKTTHSWGLLRMNDARLVTDDWYYVRPFTGRPVAYGSEKNCYIDADISKAWPEYEGLVQKAVFDKQQRAVVDVRWIAGPGSVIPLTTMYDVILLKRDPQDKALVTEMEPKAALEYLRENDFCNPHQLVRDKRKMAIRYEFFSRLTSSVRVHLVNTTSPARETQDLIRQAIFGAGP
jgi:hypothetical protein